MNYLLIYFSALLITFSILGYGYIFSKIVNKELLRFNIGFIGLIGLLFLVIISYITIFFTKHGYTHNIILHTIGILSFYYYVYEKKLKKEIIGLLVIFTVLFCGLLIIRNHDDFNYYHFTYSLGLTENKLLIGLGNFQHGYKHHSSIFFLNSIFYLPFIKYFLFHAVGWITLVFVNFIILKFITSIKNIKDLNFELIFYLTTLLFINYKFFRIGGYGTDVSGQLILFIIVPLIFSTLRSREFKNNLDMIILLITYVVTLKSFFILNFLFLFGFLFFFNYKKIINYIIQSKIIATSILTILLLTSINIAYTGCVIYPVKQTCFFNKLSWTVSEKHMDHLSQWYEIWAKSGAGPNFGVEDPEIYIQKFNWVSNWYDAYFKYKGLETILGILFLFTLLVLIFFSKNKKPPKKIEKKIMKILYLLSFILFFEWFYNRPTLRYGGYYLLCFMFFIPFSYWLSHMKIKISRAKNSIYALIILSFLLFNVKNFNRINWELKNVKDNNFPFFYAPIQKYKTIELDYDVKVYIPQDYDGCYVTKTPCVAGAKKAKAIKKYTFTIFNKKN